MDKLALRIAAIGGLVVATFAPGGCGRSPAGIKGLAKTRGDDASLAFPSVGQLRVPPNGRAVALDVELVFADRNERQRMLLVPQGNGWVITSIDTAQVIEPPVRYGTPVFEEPDRPQSEQEVRQ